MALLPGPRPAPLSALHPALSSAAPSAPLPPSTHGPRPRLLGPPPLPPWPLAPPPRPPLRPPGPFALPLWPSAPPSLALGPASSASAPPAQALRPASSAPHHTSQTSSSLPRRGLPGWLALAAALIPPLCGAPRPYRSRPPSSALPPLRRCAPPSLPGQAGVRPPRASLCRLSPPRAALRPGLLSPGPRTGCERSKYNFPGPRPPRRRCHPRALTSPPESWPCPGSPPSRCPWRATLEATFVGEGNARSALSLSRWKSDARLEGELPLWKRKSGGWKASAFCLNRSRPASPVASPSGEASRPEAACKVGCVLHPGNLQRAIIGGSTLRVGGLACEAAAARWWAAETS